MAADNRTENALFPDVPEHYGPNADSGNRGDVTASIGSDSPVSDLAPRSDAGVGPAAIPDPPVLDLPVQPGQSTEFGQLPKWLVTTDSPSSAEKPSGRGKHLLIGSAAASLVAIATAATVLVWGGTDRETAGAANAAPSPAVAPPGEAVVAESPAATSVWCADSFADGRSVGRGSGSIADGPGVIRAFDHAYYVERDGGRVASLMVAPNPVPEIQKWIDEVPLGTEHCVTITATPEPNVYTVDLGLRMPAGSEGVIRQRITVAPAPTGFRIAKVEDLR